MAVRVPEPYPNAGGPFASAAGLQHYSIELREAAERAFGRIEAVAREADVAQTTRFEQDRPAPDAIEAAAEAVEADLVLMGSQGRTGLARVLLGNVADKVLALARVPALIVKWARAR